MLDLYGSNVPPVLHTRQPTCPPAPVPPLTALDTRELINILAPSLLFLLILPWLIVHQPRKQQPPPPPPPPTPNLTPTQQGGYLIYGWGGEDPPMFWTTPTCVQYPQFNPINEVPKTESVNEISLTPIDTKEE
jgi:hypothetical protein